MTMADEPVLPFIPVEKMRGYQRTTDRLGVIGPCIMETPHGPVNVEDAPGLLVMQVTRDGLMHSIAILVYEPLPGKGAGLVVQMTADSARATAASLMMMADRLEPVGKTDA